MTKINTQFLQNRTQETSTTDIKMVRSPYYAEKVVIVDGQDGCGKTLFTSVVAAMDRVELLTYAYELEYVCSLAHLGKMSQDAAQTMVRMLTDLQLYNTLMGRETNFRYSDLSSAFQSVDPLRYIRRLFQNGDEAVPARIRQTKPILHLATHNLLGNSEAVFGGLGKRVVMIEIIRHPLYMLKQQALNMELLEDARDFRLYFQYQDREVPWWTKGWEDLFIKSNSIEKAIYNIRHFTHVADQAREQWKERFNAQILTIPFECFVINPWSYMDQIEKIMDSKITVRTKRELKKQNVPRKLVADGVGLKIYKRCGWQPPQKDSTENNEFLTRWNFAKESASSEILKKLDELSTAYEEKYLGGKKDYPRNI